jgi:hypothetical protein
MNRTTTLIAALAFALTGCGRMRLRPRTTCRIGTGLLLADLSKSTDAQTLNALRRLTAPFHDLDNATSAGFALFSAPPLYSTKWPRPDDHTFVRAPTLHTTSRLRATFPTRRSRRPASMVG